MPAYFNRISLKNKKNKNREPEICSRKRNELQEMKRLARDRYLFGQENQPVTRKRNEGRRRGRGRGRGEKMADERGDIRTGDEKIKGERGWGGGGGGAYR